MNASAAATFVFPPDFKSWRQVASYAISPEWLAQHGVKMHEVEVEPQWPVQVGKLDAPGGRAFVVIGNAGRDGVGLWADPETPPTVAARWFEDVVGLDQKPSYLYPENV